MFGRNKKKDETAQAKPQRKMDDPAAQKATFWDRKLWMKKNPMKGNNPLPGALACIGKDRHNRSITIPIVHLRKFERPAHKLPSLMRPTHPTYMKIEVKEANDISEEYMRDTLAALDKYTIRK